VATRSSRFSYRVWDYCSALCLISAAFYPNDPSWNSAGGTETHNWAGAIGANVAATGFQLIGLAAFLLPLLYF
jgi:DNA segregation ATPase FtsK/SpoIIIE-like protein